MAKQDDDKWVSELRRITVLFVNLGVGEDELVGLNTMPKIKRIHEVLSFKARHASGGFWSAAPAHGASPPSCPSQQSASIRC